MTEKPDASSYTADHAHSVSTISDLISDLQKRGNFKRGESWFILFVILVLLVAAGYFFKQAKEIATNDTGINTAVRQQEVENKLALDTRHLDTIREQVNSVKVNLPFLSDISGKLTKTVNVHFYCQMPLIDKGNIMTVTELIIKLKETVDSPSPCLPLQKGATIEEGKPHISLILFGPDVGLF